MIKIFKRIQKRIKRRFWQKQMIRRYQVNHVDEHLPWDWEKEKFNRVSFINAAIQQIMCRRGHCRYLEIGCLNDDAFKTIPLKIGDKIGVDPEKGGTHRMTSDAFFASNNDLFDVIFIDGLHEYLQCQRDAINALNHLVNGGFILFHDFIPTDWRIEHVPRLQDAWTGDVWKVGYELSLNPGVEMVIAKADNGVGIVRKISEVPSYQDLRESLLHERFRHFLSIIDRLPIVEAESALDFIARKSPIPQ
ncbi:MAG: class I SAM-dependent methyltransferase [Magnetococcales bacterium]|nr:class I SAM-dependent methyltransferase [Magnetococcales bacterium]